jgi:hypothetical protein
VIFLLCRVGENDEAGAFLKGLEKDENLKGMVYVAPYRINEQLAIFQKCGDNEGYRQAVSLRPTVNIKL